MQKLFVAALAVVLCVGATVGCSNKNPQGRKAVQGTIKLAGTPIAKGSINFQPDDSNSPKTDAGANIVDGVFTIPAEGGLVPGKYIVSFSASVDTGETTETGMGPQPIFKETVPTAYLEESSELSVEFSGKGPYNYDFDIPNE